VGANFSTVSFAPPSSTQSNLTVDASTWSAGSSLYLVVAFNGTTATTAVLYVTDGPGNTYRRASASHNNTAITQTTNVEIWYADNIMGPPNSIEVTVTMTSVPSVLWLAAFNVLSTYVTGSLADQTSFVPPDDLPGDAPVSLTPPPVTNGLFSLMAVAGFPSTTGFQFTAPMPGTALVTFEAAVGAPGAYMGVAVVSAAKFAVMNVTANNETADVAWNGAVANAGVRSNAGTAINAPPNASLEVVYLGATGVPGPVSNNNVRRQHAERRVHQQPPHVQEVKGVPQPSVEMPKKKGFLDRLLHPMAGAAAPHRPHQEGGTRVTSKHSHSHKSSKHR
jgi:hypothetical protein